MTISNFISRIETLVEHTPYKIHITRYSNGAPVQQGAISIVYWPVVPNPIDVFYKKQCRNRLISPPRLRPLQVLKFARLSL